MTDDALQRATLMRARALKAAALSPAVVLFASAIRLLLISNYDTTTATAIASAGGVVGTLLGTIVPLLPPYLPLLTILLAVARRWTLTVFAGCAAVLLSPTYVDSPRDGLITAWTAAGQARELVKQWDWFRLWQDYPGVVLSAVAGALLVFFVAPMPLWSRPVVFRVAYCAIVAAICAGVTLLVYTFYRVPFSADLVSEIARRPWMPAEEIVLKSGGLPRVGYTLSTNDNWHIVLNESNRTIFYLRADNVATRTSCKPSSTYIERPRLPVFPLRNVRPEIAKTCVRVP